ncbi:hypothetical protein ACFL2V_19740, partial [Pseudomonadota bacterium]
GTETKVKPDEGTPRIIEVTPSENYSTIIRVNPTRVNYRRTEVKPNEAHFRIDPLGTAQTFLDLIVEEEYVPLTYKGGGVYTESSHIMSEVICKTYALNLAKIAQFEEYKEFSSHSGAATAEHPVVSMIISTLNNLEASDGQNEIAIKWCMYALVACSPSKAIIDQQLKPLLGEKAKSEMPSAIKGYQKTVGVRRFF